jgi:hypothetical protein
VLVVDGTLVPTRDHIIAAQSKNYRYSTNHQVVIDADTRLVVAVGRPFRRHNATNANGGYPGTGLVMPHRRRRGKDLPDWKEAHNKSHSRSAPRVEHVFARMKTWKTPRDCRLKGDGVHHATLGIARMHNLVLAG